jgi:ribokinase
VVVGSINQDLVVTVTSLPGPGQTVLGDRFERHGGGKGANQAVAARRAGAEVTLVAAVGNDDLGREALTELAHEGVQIDRIQVVDDAATGVAIIAVDRHGENQIATAAGANMALDAECVRAVLDDTPADVCLVCLEIPDAAVLAAVEAAAAHQVPIVVNPAPARPLPDAVYHASPILVPNEDELQQLTGERDVATVARHLHGRTGAPVVVTRGSRGATIVEGDRVTEVAAQRVEPVDSTGAGDTFAAWLAVGIGQGLPLLEAVERANVAAALSTTQAGARVGMPGPTDIETAVA